MKITKRQLRRIIKEEKARVLNEQQDLVGDAKATAKVIHQRLDKILENVLEGLPVEQLERIASMEVTGPGGWDEATQALARIALADIASAGGAARGM